MRKPNFYRGKECRPFHTSSEPRLEAFIEQCIHGLIGATKNVLRIIWQLQQWREEFLPVAFGAVEENRNYQDNRNQWSGFEGKDEAAFLDSLA